MPNPETVRDREKESQFMFMVQTGLLVKYAADPGDGTAPLCRPAWAVEHLEEAFRFAPLIPPDITAAEAATAYLCLVIDSSLLTDEQRELVGILTNS